MAEIQEKTEQKKQKVELDLTPRQLKILESELTKPRKATGKQTVESVAKKLGIGRTTYYADLKKAGNIQDWQDRQVARLKQLEHVVFAGLLANIEKGNYDAIRDWYLRFAHLFTDKIEISAIQGMSDEELVENARKAILAAIAQKTQKKLAPSNTGLASISAEAKKIDGISPESDPTDSDLSKQNFNGEGIA